MKKIEIYLSILLAAIAMTGCTATYHASTGYAADDMYDTHNLEEITQRQKAEAEAQKKTWERQAMARQKTQQAQHTQQAQSSQQLTASTPLSYDSVLADDYESAYARRLKGFNSPSYKMPSSYENVRYSNTFHYVSAYDPAFYNIVVSGDEVWVEPKYVTSMFGSWGGTVIPGDWNCTWNLYFSPWYSHYFNWNWYYGYNPWRPRPWAYSWWGYDPWYWGGSWGGRFGWGGYWHGYWDGYWGHTYPGWYWGWGHYRPHNYRYDGYNHRGGYYRGRGYNTGRSGSGYRDSYNRGGTRHDSYNSGRTQNRRSGSGYNRGRSNSNRSTYNQRTNDSYRNNSSYNNNYRGGNSSGSYSSGSFSGGGYRSSGGSYNRGR